MVLAAPTLIEEWQAANPTTPAEVAAFYRDSRALADDVAAHHDRDLRRQWTRALVEFARAGGVRSVLDLGCGRGDDLAALAQAEIPTLVGVEPNAGLYEATVEALRTAGARDYAVFESLDEYEQLGVAAGIAPEQFDLVLCIDVLEHVPDPDALLNRLIARIGVGGVLAEFAPTWDIANPTHLRANWGWTPDPLLRARGFQRTAKVEGGLRLWRRVRERTAPGQSVILVSYRAVSPETVGTLWELREQGWSLVLQTNDALIGRARSMAVSRWYKQTHDDVFLMIDSDIVFGAADAARIVARCRAGYPVLAGAYTIRGGAHLACRGFPDLPITFAEDALPVPIQYGATGFLAVHRDVIAAMMRALPLVNATEPWSYWPFFDTRIVRHENGDAEQLSEDWHFCKLARELGFTVSVDPSIRLGHLGTYEYHLEDMIALHGGGDDGSGREPLTAPRGGISRIVLREGYQAGGALDPGLTADTGADADAEHTEQRDA